MPFSNIDNYIFVPNIDKHGFGTLYELGVEGNFAPSSFVLLPYKNPQVQKPSAKFYPIKNKTEIKIPTSTHNNSAIYLKAKTSKEDYIQKVKKLKQHIQLGNIYEINFCIQFFAQDVNLNPCEIFAELYQLAKAPYSALVKINDEYIIGASPELFLKKEKNSIYTKPIKGTIKRGENKIEDDVLKNYLFNSIKERTENVMAVDVARNDLSHFAKKGTVTVNKLYNIESFETVNQMVSTISCEIKENTSFETIINATFPMASMTGAPKLRAMTLIDEVEDFERHNYSGAMGLINENGDFTLSVNIRSIFYNQLTKHLLLAVGGAITYLSEPEKEYEECLLKAKALLRVLKARIE